MQNACCWVYHRMGVPQDAPEMHMGKRCMHMQQTMRVIPGSWLHSNNRSACLYSKAAAKAPANASSCQLCSCELCCLPLRTYVAILYICLGSETRHQNVSRQQAGYRCKQCSVVLTVKPVQTLMVLPCYQCVPSFRCLLQTYQGCR